MTTGSRMRLPLPFALATTVAVATALPAPTALSAQGTCTAGTASNYAALGSAGCTIAGVTFRNLGVTEQVGSLDRAFLTPYLRPLTEGLFLVGFEVRWTPALALHDRTLTFSSGEQRVITQDAGWLTTLDISVRGGALVGAMYDFVESSATQGNLPTRDAESTRAGSTYAETAVFGTLGPEGALNARSRVASNCDLRSLYSTPCLGDTRSSVAFSARESTTGAFYAYATWIGGEYTSQGGTAEISSIRGGWIVDRTASAVVPEPSTWALLGTGLLTLGTLAARRHKRAAI